MIKFTHFFILQKFMKSKSFYFLLIICVLFQLHYSKANLQSQVKFANVAEANKLLCTEDVYTKSWGVFDIQSRSKNAKGTKDMVFSFMKKQTLEWDATDKIKINKILRDIDSLIKVNKFNITLPSEITLIKSTLQEEGNAEGYTRENYIVLKNELVALDNLSLKKILIHELFHIISRNNPKLRAKLYKAIGFEMCNVIKLPKSMNDIKISNPDAPLVDSYIQVKYQDETIDCAMILYSTRDYTGGSFMDYIDIGFVPLNGLLTKQVKKIRGNYYIIPIQEITGFLEQVGMNTKYIINPEEIIAENFVMALLNDKNVKSPKIIEKVKKILKE